jgi:hypothetical protein
MRVLIVGYGKIGRIKAPMWSEMGATVYVYEQNDRLHPKILGDGYSLFSFKDQVFDIVDISTPAGMHYGALAWAMDAVAEPDIYLIEKPLASTREELRAFKTLVSENPTLSRKIVINESYYNSTLLDAVAKDIASSNANIQSIHIELSKNRLKDLEAGRFFDDALEAVGLEVPHMLAILDKFGVSLPEGCMPSLIVDTLKRANQAFILRTNESGPEIVFESYLGNFRYEGTSITSNTTITRKAKITTDILDYQIEFDPLIDHERFHGKLTIFEKGIVVSKKTVLDNHLDVQLRLILNGTPLHDTSIGITKALEFTETLLRLRGSCEVTELQQVSEYNVTLNRKDKEIYNGIRNY